MAYAWAGQFQEPDEGESQKDKPIDPAGWQTCRGPARPLIFSLRCGAFRGRVQHFPQQVLELCESLLSNGRNEEVGDIFR